MRACVVLVVAGGLVVETLKYSYPTLKGLANRGSEPTGDAVMITSTSHRSSFIMGPSTYHLALSSSLRKYSSNTHSRKECCGFRPWEDELPGMFSSVLLNSFDLPRIACRLPPQNNYIYILKRNYFGKEIIMKVLVDCCPCG